MNRAELLFYYLFYFFAPTHICEPKGHMRANEGLVRSEQLILRMHPFADTPFPSQVHHARVSSREGAGD